VESRAENAPRWPLLLLPLAFGLDQLSKHWIRERFAMGEEADLLPGWLSIQHSRNAGAFFSLGADLPRTVRGLLFPIVTLLAMGLMFALYRAASPTRRLYRAGILLLLAGALGNLVDRVLDGEVVDFLHVHILDYVHWAIFNLADVWIFLGLLLVLFAGTDRSAGPDRPSSPLSSEIP